MQRNPRKLACLGRNKICCVSGIRIVTWNGSQSFGKKTKILEKVPERKGCGVHPPNMEKVLSKKGSRHFLLGAGIHVRSITHRITKKMWVDAVVTLGFKVILKVTNVKMTILGFYINFDHIR